jgi:DNA-binding response OmpR family regulator
MEAQVIPLSRSSEATRPSHVPPSPPAAGRVLLAEDDREMRHLLASVLRSSGYHVIEVQDGVELIDQVAAARASGQDIDLVITDVRMPQVGGLEALGWLQEVGSTVPAVVVTGFGDRRVHDEAKRLGAWAVLDKPFDLDELCAVVDALRTEQRIGGHHKGARP